MAPKPDHNKILFLLIARILLLPIALIVGLLIYIPRERNKSLESKSPGEVSSPESKKETPASNVKVEFNDIIFPEKFFFGTASSDFQTTGGTGNTDWNVYIKECETSNKCKSNLGQTFTGPGPGTLFLERYKEDFDLAGQFGDQVHRLSLEWARIQPEEKVWDVTVIEEYRKIFLYMRSRGIEPMICLNHFALPLWFSEMGGWESPKAAYYYSQYAEMVAANLGVPLKIKWWLTFNEPQVILLPYTKGNWPPNKPIKSFQDSAGLERALKVASNLIDSHRLAYRAIHNILKSKDVMVSYASAPGIFYPRDPDSPLDQIAYNAGTALDTLSFDYAVGTVDRDFIGLNYYGRVKLKFYISVPGMVLPNWLTAKNPFAIQWEMPFERKQGNRPKEFYPRALYDLIMKFKGFSLPVVITENGLSDGEDKFREEFMVLHLKAVHDAINDGVNVLGYQYWALTDTWEWDGVFSQMGLIAIDRDNNFARKLRPSAITYGEIIKMRGIKKELLEKHKELLIDPEVKK